MNNAATLELQAIQAAKKQDWPAAISFNQNIIAIEPNNIGARIRLGVAYVQLGKTKDAETEFKEVLKIDKSNALARKHLQKLKNNQTITVSALPLNEEFIEEPGKTKTVELHRLANKDQLEQLSVGTQCDLKPKNRFISVEVHKSYIGSLPEDLSARLSKLIQTGNEYTCYIQSVSATACSVFIKETARSEKNEYVHSFPLVKSQLATINDMFLADDTVPLPMEDIPFQVVATDAEEDEEPKGYAHLGDEPMEEGHPEEPEAPMG